VISWEVRKSSQHQADTRWKAPCALPRIEYLNHFLPVCKPSFAHKLTNKDAD
jgi:hypothetical protein